MTVGSLDTKGAEYTLIKELIEKQDVSILIVDFRVMGPPAQQPDINRDEIAKAGGGDLAHLTSGDHKDEVMKVMADDLVVTVHSLYGIGLTAPGTDKSPARYPFGQRSYSRLFGQSIRKRLLSIALKGEWYGLSGSCITGIELFRCG